MSPFLRSPFGTLVEAPCSEYVRVPNDDVPSDRSERVKVHAPETPGTLNVGEVDVDTHDTGVTVAANHCGTRSPLPVPAGNAARSTGLPAIAALRSTSDDPEHADASNAIATTTAASPR
jgi:hypothetical protein